MHSRQHKSKTDSRNENSEEDPPNDQSVKQQKVTHTGETTFDCNHCGKRFLFIQLLRNHEKIHTVTEKSYLCDICSKIFSTEELLNKHREVHMQRRQVFGNLNKAEPVLCKVCGQKFKRQKALRIHMISRHGDNRFICSVCGYKAQRKQHFEDHMNIHTGSRPYRCSICDQDFKQKGSLNIHIRKAHEGSAPTDHPCSTTEEQAAAEAPV